MAVEVVSFRDMYVIPIAMGIAQYLKVYIGVNTKLIPLIVVGICAAGDMILAATLKQPINAFTLLGGMVAGFATIGVFSGVRKMVEKNGGIK